MPSKPLFISFHKMEIYNRRGCRMAGMGLAPATKKESNKGVFAGFQSPGGLGLFFLGTKNPERDFYRIL